MEPDHSHRDGYVEQRFAIEVTRGEEVVVEKIAAMFTSKDMAISEPLGGPGVGVQRGRFFEELLEPPRRGLEPPVEQVPD